MPEEQEQTDPQEQIDAAKYYQVLRHIPVFETLGIKLLELEKGRSRLQYTATRQFYHGGDVIQGGIITAALDAAIAFAALAGLPMRSQLATTNINVNFLRAVVAGEYFVDGKILKFGKRAIFAESALYDSNGTLCATATSTLVSWLD
jgi:uncharacterized protein (TIGR00369 family)